MNIPYPTVTGVVTERPPQVNSFIVSASAISPTVTVIDAVQPPSPAPTPPIFVTVDGVASSPDNPGMKPYPVKAFFVQGQTEAVKSAAQNTAVEFGLNATLSADTASKFARQAFDQDVAALPDLNNTTVVIIPP